MPTTLSSLELDKDTNKAINAANLGPVFITENGRPSHVLLSIEHYQLLCGSSGSIIDLLAMPKDDEIDFDPKKSNYQSKPDDLS